MIYDNMLRDILFVGQMGRETPSCARHERFRSVPSSRQWETPEENVEAAGD